MPACSLSLLSSSMAKLANPSTSTQQLSGQPPDVIIHNDLDPCLKHLASAVPAVSTRETNRRRTTSTFSHLTACMSCTAPPLTHALVLHTAPRPRVQPCRCALPRRMCSRGCCCSTVHAHQCHDSTPAAGAATCPAPPRAVARTALRCHTGGGRGDGSGQARGGGCSRASGRGTSSAPPADKQRCARSGC
jgi:hypothetical protein